NFPRAAESRLPCASNIRIKPPRPNLLVAMVDEFRICLLNETRSRSPQRRSLFSKDARNRTLPRLQNLLALLRLRAAPPAGTRCRKENREIVRRERPSPC